jgi:hypothetical protein
MAMGLWSRITKHAGYDEKIASLWFSNGNTGGPGSVFDHLLGDQHE